MKKLLILALVTLSFLVTMNGCKKENIPTPDPIVNLLVDEEPQALVDTLETVIFNNPIITEVSDINDPTILDYPSFLDYDPFTTVLVRRTGSVDSCVKGIEITSAEKEKLNKAWLAKLDCEKSNKEIIARIHREYESWSKTQKYAMYTKYMKTKDSLMADFKTKVAYVNDLYTKGLITLEQKNKSLTEIETKYHNDLAALEKSYKSSFTTLNTKLKEKLKSSIDRATACGKIKDCEKVWLNSVMEILGKSRYKKWIECYKYHYKKK